MNKIFIQVVIKVDFKLCAKKIYLAFAIMFLKKLIARITFEFLKLYITLSYI